MLHLSLTSQQTKNIGPKITILCHINDSRKQIFKKKPKNFVCTKETVYLFV